MRNSMLQVMHEATSRMIIWPLEAFSNLCIPATPPMHSGLMKADTRLGESTHQIKASDKTEPPLYS